MIIYQTYNTVDMAGTDAWHPTLAHAIEYLRIAYGVKGPIKLDDDGEWEGLDEDGVTVYLSRHNIVTTRKGLCAALQNLPLR